MCAPADQLEAELLGKPIRYLAVRVHAPHDRRHLLTRRDKTVDKLIEVQRMDANRRKLLTSIAVYRIPTAISPLTFLH